MTNCSSLLSLSSLPLILICFSEAAIGMEEEPELVLLERSCVACDVSEMALNTAYYPNCID